MQTIVRDTFLTPHGEVPEWSNGLDSKSSELRKWFRGFESLPLRHVKTAASLLFLRSHVINQQFQS
jgi:hypothetical protein